MGDALISKRCSLAAYRHTSIKLSTQERVHNRGTLAKGGCCVSEHVSPPTRVCASLPPRPARECSKVSSDAFRTSTESTPDPTSHAWSPWHMPSRFLMRDPPVSGTSAETTSAGRSRPESAQTMLRQAVLIAFASSAALALHAPNLQALQRGLHTRLAASSRRGKRVTRPRSTQ